MPRPHRPPRVLLLLVLAAMAAVAVGAVALPLAGSGDGDRPPAAVVAKAAVHRTLLTQRDPRPIPTAAVVAVGLALAGLCAPRPTLAPCPVRPRRRLSDVGDDWRALLRGAPPSPD